jgi:hypothetical protein
MATKMSICRQCDRVVFTDQDSDQEYVELDSGETMHAECYEDWQDELEKRKAQATA